MLYKHKVKSTQIVHIVSKAIVMCSSLTCMIYPHIVSVYCVPVYVCINNRVRCIFVRGSIKRQITLVVKLNRFRLYSTRCVWCLLVLSYWPCSRSISLYHSLVISLSLSFSFFIQKYITLHNQTLLLFAFSHSFSHRTARRTLHRQHLHARTQTINSSAMLCFAFLCFCSFSFINDYYYYFI